MTDLHLEDVAKVYGTAGVETRALDGISLDVADGEFFTLVGPSGCGKTTTLRVIAGFEAPTAGTVRFGELDVAGVPPEERDVGIVFQSYALFPHMSVAENVGYGLRFRDPPGGVTREERVAELLDLVDLKGMGDRDPTALSGGQQQRVALARALAPGPSVLLLDEPMSALDATLRERLRRQVKTIQSELGITTVYVTHDQEEALAVSDRVAVMNDGRIEQVGMPQEIYREPASRFVASFVGDNNVFEGRVVAVEPDGVDVRVNGTAFSLPPVDGDAVTFGVRPEALSVDSPTNSFTVRVESTEFLGERVRVHGDWNGTPVVLRTDEVPQGDRLTVGFDPEDVHLIDVS